MKVKIHPRREWREPGKATGCVRCVLRLPAIDLEAHGWFIMRPSEGLSEVCTFLRRRLPTVASALEDGSFTIVAEIRAHSMGVRRQRLVRWSAGESVARALQQARQRWAELPREQTKFGEPQEELDLSDAIVKLKVRSR